MFVTAGVDLAFRGAGITGCYAGLELGSENFDRGFRLARQDLAGRIADVRTVLVEPYAPDKLLDIFLSETGVGAIRAGLGAFKAGPDAFGQHIKVQHLHAAWMHLQHL
jgi:hypothetical protein